MVPLADVSFGVAAGASVENNKNNGMGGLGGKISPSAVLVITNGSTRLVNVKNQDAITKLLDMVPDLLDRFAPVKKEKAEEVVERFMNLMNTATVSANTVKILLIGTKEKMQKSGGTLGKKKSTNILKIITDPKELICVLMNVKE